MTKFWQSVANKNEQYSTVVVCYSTRPKTTGRCRRHGEYASSFFFKFWSIFLFNLRCWHNPQYWDCWVKRKKRSRCPCPVWSLFCAFPPLLLKSYRSLWRNLKPCPRQIKERLNYRILRTWNLCLRIRIRGYAVNYRPPLPLSFLSIQ